MKAKKILSVAAILLFAGTSIGSADTYKGVPRTFLFNPSMDVCLKDTAEYKKNGPYVIGFSNAGLGDSWRVVMLHSMEKAAAEHKDQIKQLLITDAGHDDAKQVSDIQDLTSRGVDLLIVSANTEQAVDPAVTRAMEQGIPVVMVDRRVSSDNFVTFVTASDAMMGRLFAQWIVEKLNGKGNIVILGGQAGSSPNEQRVKAAMQVLDQYPDIKILDTVYSDWSPVKGKQVMQAVIAKYGKNINAVLSTHGLQTPGSIEAFLEAGFKPGEIPPHTTSDVNGPMQLALKNKVPMLEVGYPPAMGGTAIQVALNVLGGKKVPCTYEINAQIATTDGDETPSIRPDLHIKDMVMPNAPPDMLVTGGMGPDYNPSTFKIDYPQ
ncbi:ABC transporter substrate-binding protein [Neorhizobium alkalisoli]|uniref:Monosaccharide ABC transporter substrate-binding protein (CUT2 family) n=1 Tax=Neorhizobium alkalisoli TaxID=528178 RepID=A0A561R969_9HYPH|nr:ABC transporter substrate-binding protein [Neorhizobium alkalisoli]TWF59134.1 monosaccharide ABC transporter substrate-binding protein (CUT2 family) [Neorhizobium alkalisoli]